MIRKSNLNTGRRLNRKWRPTPRSKMEDIGIPTGLKDKFNNEIHSGDKVRIYNKNREDYEGIVLWHRDMKQFGCFMGLWYGEENPYDTDCYGKYITIPKDNGMRMDIEIISV